MGPYFPKYGKISSEHFVRFNYSNKFNQWQFSALVLARGKNWFTHIIVYCIIFLYYSQGFFNFCWNFVTIIEFKPAGVFLQGRCFELWIQYFTLYLVSRATIIKCHRIPLTSKSTNQMTQYFSFLDYSFQQTCITMELTILHDYISY